MKVVCLWCDCVIAEIYGDDPSLPNFRHDVCPACKSGGFPEERRGLFLDKRPEPVSVTVPVITRWELVSLVVALAALVGVLWVLAEDVSSVVGF